MTEENKNQELENLREAYKQNPDDKDSAIQLAQLYTDLGWLNEAITIYKHLIEKYPNQFSILLAYGNICVTKQLNKEAIKTFQKLTVIRPERIEGWNNLGIVQLSLGDYSAARNSFKKVLEMEPQNHGALLNMGNYYDHVGKIDKAIEMFKKATAVKPYFSDAWFNLGNAYITQKKYEKAIEVFEKSLKYNPKFSSSFKNIGYSYEKMDNYEKAEEYYLKTLDCNKTDHTLYINIASIYMKQGKYDKAKDFFLRAVKLAPNNAAGWMGLRQLSLKKGDIKTYMKSTLSILHRLENNEIIESLKIFRKLGQYDNVKSILQSTDKLQREGDELDAERMLAYMDSDRDKTSMMYRRLSGKSAVSNHILHCLAAYCMKTGAFDKVIKHIGDIDNKEIADMELLWSALIEKNELDIAEQLVESYLQDNQDCFEGWYQLAKINAIRNDRDQAKEFLLHAIEVGFTDIHLIENDKNLAEIYSSIL